MRRRSTGKIPPTPYLTPQPLNRATPPTPPTPPILPARHRALTVALAQVAELGASDQDVRLRVGLHDGTVLDGFLLTASPDHLSLRLPSAQARLIPADEIRSIYLARRRPVRELLPVTLVILGATAGLVGLARFPILESWFSRSAMWLAILGFALISVLQRHTRLGHWLTAWKPLFEPPPQ